MRRVGQHIIVPIILTSAWLLSVGCSGDSEGDPGASQDVQSGVPDGPSQSDDTAALASGGGDVLSPDRSDDAGPQQGEEGEVPDGAGLDGQQPEEDAEVPVVPGPVPAPTDDGYPGAGLVVKIVSPGGFPRAAVIGSKVTVGGVLFGQTDTLSWQSSGGASGAIQPAAFWNSGPIDLTPGDNTVTITAASGTQVASDSIVITYNPAFKFDDKLLARPDIAWQGSSSTVVFTVPISLYPNFIASTATLLEVDADGNTLSDLGKMVDNGQTGSTGDEIQSDGVFTKKASVACSTQDARYYRAAVQVTQGATSYTAYTPLIPVWCLEHLTPAVCQGHQQVIQQAEQQAQSGVSAEDVVGTLLTNPQVADAGQAEDSGHSLWIQFTSGVLGAVLLAPPGWRGSGDDEFLPADPSDFDPIPIGGNTVDIGSKKAVVLAPFSNEFGAGDDGPEVATALATSECPSFNVEGGTALQQTAANLDRYRDLSLYGVSSISTHGEALFGTLDPLQKATMYHWDHQGAQEVLWTGEPVQCGQLLQTNKSCTVNSTNPTGGCPSGTVCQVTQGTGGSNASGVCIDRTQADLRMGNVIITNKGYAVTPAFFERYAGRGYPSALVNLGACRSLYNGSLASTLFAHGAQAITGFSDYVETGWAKEKVVELFEGSVGSGLIGQYFISGEDPSTPGTWWRLFGAGNLSLSNSEIINGSFETGDTTGWTADGDGRIITKLGSSIPVGGKFMGLLSTGLGFTVQTGSLEQDFCIPADKTEVQIYWKFFSEEFKEYCGSQFQDTFSAVLTGGGGQLTVVDTKVDDLCGYTDGSCGLCPAPVSCDSECMGGSACSFDSNTGLCSGSYPCNCGKYYKGLTPSDVEFDQGGVFNILWQKTVKNVQALAGAGTVTMRLYSSDTGDSIFDTVILIDSVEFR